MDSIGRRKIHIVETLRYWWWKWDTKKVRRETEENVDKCYRRRTDRTFEQRLQK